LILYFKYNENLIMEMVEFAIINNFKFDKKWTDIVLIEINK